MSKSRRSMFKEGLTESVKHSFETKDSYGEGSDYLKKGVKVTKWVPKHEAHIIDFMPYIAGPMCPNQREGKATHVLDVWVHSNIGPGGNKYICMAKTYHEACPICALQRRLRQEGAPKEDIDALQPKRRTLYWVIVRDSVEEEKKGIQLWEVSFHFMEKKIAALAKNPRTGGYVPFADPDEGKTVSFSIEKAGEKKIEFIGHQFIDRDTPITDEEVDWCIENPLDALIHIPTLEELEVAVASMEKGTAAPEERREVSRAEKSRDAKEEDQEKTETPEYTTEDEQPWSEDAEGGEEGNDPEPEPEPEPDPEPVKEPMPKTTAPAASGRRPLPRARK